MKRMRTGAWFVGLMMAGIAFCGGAATVEWIGTVGVEGNWTNAANWNGGELPGPGDTAGVNNGGIVALDSDLSSSVNPALQLSNGSTLRVRAGAATTNMTVNLYESNIELSGGMLHVPYAPVSSYFGQRGTNRIVMTGGTLSGTVRYGRNANVDTTLVLSNGTVVSESYEANYGSAGGTATVIQEGGYHGWRLILGSGGTGRYFLNGGELYAPYPFIGWGNAVGYLEMGPKGRITLGGRNGTEPIYLANGNNTTGTIILNSVTNNLTENGALRNAFAQFQLCPNAGSSTVTTNSTAALIFNNCQMALTNGILFNKANDCRMALVVNGGRVSVCTAQGALTSLSWPANYSTNTTATLTVTNGAAFSASIYYMYSGGQMVNAGGAIIASSAFRIYSTNAVVSLLAGSLTVTNQLYVGPTRTTELRMRDGHALTISDFQDIVGTTKTNEFLLTYQLHQKPDWVVPLTFTGSSARRIGHLRIALEGGVLLSDTNACTVAKTLNSDFYGNQPFLSVPDTNLWLEARSGTKQSFVSLSAAGNKGALAMGGAMSASFAPAPMGYVSLSNVDTRRLVDLTVRLSVEPQGGTTLADIVAGFVSAGYTNSVAAAGNDGCNVTLAIPAAAVYATKGTAAESYFVWDFTGTTIQSIDTVTTNALVSKVSVAYTKLPPGGTLIRVQ